MAGVSALVLAGGSGTRFWPLSRRLRPKQLLALEGERSLLRDTVDRLAPLIGPESVWVCTTEALAEAVRADLPEVPPEQVLAEPMGRNTAPALGWAVREMPAAARQGAIAVLPADHRVGDPTAFRETLAAAARVALDERRIMTLGVTPHRPETGFGYLELEPPAAGGQAGGVRRVQRFVEKPDAARAALYAASGHHLWNAGIFVFQGDDFLDLLARHAPEIAQGLAKIEAEPARLAELYAALPSISIDYALMEKLDTIGTLPLDCGWSDLGSWEALSEVLPADAEGNAVRGEALAVDAADNLLVAEEGTIAVLGVSGLVVVRTGDTVLVCPKERSQEVRRLLDELAARGRGDLL